MRRTPLVRRSAAALLTPLALSVLVACGSDSGDEASPASSTPSATAGASDDADANNKDQKDSKGSPDASPGSNEEGGDEGETPDTSTAPTPAAAPTPGTKLTPQEFVDLFRSSMDSTARMTMSVEGPTSTRAEGDVDYSSDPPSMSMTMDNAEMGGKVRFVMLDNVMYMHMGQLSNNKYIKMDLNDPSGLLGEDISSQVDPKASMDQFEKGVQAVRFVGTERLDGDTVRRYSVSIDAKKLGGGDPAAAGMPKQIKYDVWFDEQDRLRKTVMGMGKRNGTVTMTLSDWGGKVDIKAPPANQVTEMPQGR